MRAALLVIVLAGCASEADLVLELHLTSTTSTVTYRICDAAHPEDCEESDGADFGDDNVYKIGIYFEAPIAPPLSVQLEQFGLVACRVAELDPDSVPSLVVIELPAIENGDLTFTNCSTCRQIPCPPI